MASVARLVESLEAVHLGGIVEDCVVRVKDSVAHIKAMDMTSSVYIQTECPFDNKDDVLGLGNLALLIKYLKSYASANMELTRNDNTLIVKPDNGATLRYLLSQVDLVPTYNSEWDELEEDPIKAILAAHTLKVELKEETVKEFLKLMGLFKPNGVLINISKRGRVSFHGGNETDHQFTLIVGDSTAQEEPLSIKLYGANLSAVLSTLTYEEPVFMYVVGSEVSIVMENSAWVLSPLSNEAGTPDSE